jgi:hypothetical protein
MQERVRQRSVEALKQSALPPRMQLHEAVKKAQGVDVAVCCASLRTLVGLMFSRLGACVHLAEATGSGPAISTSASAQFSFKPEVRTQVPDFSKSHSQWTAALQATPTAERNTAEAIRV